MVKNKYLYKKPNFFRQKFSFEGVLGVGEFWSEVGISVIGYLCLIIVACIAISVLVPGTTEELNSYTGWAALAFAVFHVLRIVALSRRRLRDAEYTAKSYLWLLLPVVGWIIFLARLCKKSV
ncbi:MAG: DUF805 domain-containing protein [Ruminococcaceae bacterium]|nr:DUF805 domain-containing protein [Oscillospiraceae bacterium]